MMISNISSANYGMNFKSKATVLKRTAPVVTAAAVAECADKFVLRNEKRALSESFDEQKMFIEEDDDFENKCYEQYYGIDINMAKSRAFRDNELFNPVRDRENHEYSRYDIDDLDYADTFTPKYFEEGLSDYDTIDTDFGDKVMPDSVKKPFKHHFEIFELPKRAISPMNEEIPATQDYNIKRISCYNRFFGKDRGIPYDDARKIIDAGFVKNKKGYDIDNKLILIGRSLYKNSGRWAKVENEIVRILKSCPDKELRDDKIITIIAMMYSDKTNMEILDCLLREEKAEEAEKNN